MLWNVLEICRELKIAAGWDQKKSGKIAEIKLSKDNRYIPGRIQAVITASIPLHKCLNTYLFYTVFLETNGDEYFSL